MSDGRVLEVARLSIIPGAEAAFEAAVREAVELFRAAPDCLSMRVERSEESPQDYVLMVEWATLEAHTVAFRNSEAFKQWRSLVSPHFSAPPAVEHLRVVANGFPAA